MYKVIYTTCAEFQRPFETEEDARRFYEDKACKAALVDEAGKILAEKEAEPDVIIHTPDGTHIFSAEPREAAEKSMRYYRGRYKGKGMVKVFRDYGEYHDFLDNEDRQWKEARVYGWV